MAFAGMLWRLWQLARGRLPTRQPCRGLRIGVTLLHAGLSGWVLSMIGRCIWPYQCGEGFAAGYAGAAIGVMAGIWAFFWFLTEGLMLFCRTETVPPVAN